MVIRRVALLLLLMSAFGLIAQAHAATTIYTDRSSWESNFSTFSTEDFSDAVLNAGVSVVSDSGNVVGGEWSDLVVPGGASTTFSFSQGIFGFGGDWDLAGPGGQGTGIAITLTLLAGGTEILTTEIPRDTSNTFWGFVTNIAFTDVLLTAGTQVSGVETFTMDNMVYSSASPVPVPAAVWLFGSGVLGLLGFRRKAS